MPESLCASYRLMFRTTGTFEHFMMSVYICPKLETTGLQTGQMKVKDYTASTVRMH